MPVLQELAQHYAGREVQFVAASVDVAEDLPQVKQYVADRKLTFHIWAGARDEDMKRFGLSALPGTVVLDRQGQVVWSYTSVVDKKELRAQVDKWLAHPSK
jgi:thiol-disulfide isomerase/thioredoxin